MSRTLPASPEVPVHNHTPQVFPGTIKGHRKEGRQAASGCKMPVCLACQTPRRQVAFMSSPPCPLGSIDSFRRMQMKSKSPKAWEEYLKIRLPPQNEQKLLICGDTELPEAWMLLPILILR